MIKLVASDLDGTILRNGAQSVDASTIEVIDKLAVGRSSFRTCKWKTDSEPEKTV